ncbi:MAG: ImmA/IrrE family metallo-endopeptidase [Prochlorotrichaceae cyanobacterium]|jgi:hypothetical protein
MSVQAIQTRQLNMTNILERLARKGLPAKYVRDRALPVWWDADLEDDPIVVAEGAGYIAKRLGLDLASVFSPEAEIEFKTQAQPKFKKRQNTDDQSLEIAQGLASRVAEMVSYTAQPQYLEPRGDAISIRQHILEQYRWVNLESLLGYCWSNGIPVVHFSLPPGTKKIDGMVAKFNDRPIIVICCNRKSPAWQAFILAHELGHILWGHVKDQCIVDEAITQDDQDSEEGEANDFAATLLLGHPQHYVWDSRIQPGRLAELARNYSTRDTVDPALVCNNYGWRRHNKDDWGIAGKAIKEFETEPNASVLINQLLLHNLDLERLDRDSQEYLRLVTGA